MCEKVSDTCLYASESGDAGVGQLELPCKCGLTPTGQAFCPKVFDAEYTTLLREAMEKFSVTGKCHTLQRFDIYECLMVQAQRVSATEAEVASNVDLLDKFILRSFERDHHNLIQYNDECVKGHSKVSQYWQAKANRTINANLHKAQGDKLAKKVSDPVFYLLLTCMSAIVWLTYRN